MEEVQMIEYGYRLAVCLLLLSEAAKFFVSFSGELQYYFFIVSKVYRAHSDSSSAKIGPRLNSLIHIEVNAS